MKKRQLNQFFSFFMLGLFLFYSCEKDTDSIAPEIIIEKPVVDDYFSYQDTIHLKIRVTDDQNLKSVSVVLVNEFFVPVDKPLIFLPSDKTTDINEGYIVSNIHLESGTYYLEVTATDGINNSVLYRRVSIIGIPRKLSKILIVTEENSTSFPVYEIDSTGSSKLLFVFNGDKCMAAINSYHQQMIIAGKSRGGVKVYDFLQKEFLWNLPPYVLEPFNSFEAVGCIGNEYLVSFTNGITRRYSYQGSILANYLAPASQSAYVCGKNGDFLLVDTKQMQQENHDIYVFHYKTGGLLQSRIMPYEVVAFYPKEKNMSWIWGNDLNNQAILKTYSTYYNVFSSVRTLPAGKLTAAIDLGNQNFLVAISNTIYWYQAGINSLTPFIQNITSGSIVYDSLSQNVYCTDGNQVKLYHFPNGQFVGSLNFPNNVKLTLLLYNR